MKLKKLIVNADDFGMTEGNTMATILAHETGILTSTTMMVNMPFAPLAAKLASRHPKLGVGVHLTLSVGRPLVDGAKSYTDENGNFRRPKSYEDGKPHADLEELYAEWKAQIEKFIQLTGHKPTHMDSHHHVHLCPWHMEVTKRLSQEYNLPVRLEEFEEDYPYPHAYLIRGFYNESASKEYFSDGNTYGLLEHEIAEVMCHPALLDQRLLDMSSYAIPRARELEVLRSSEVKNWIEQNDIELVNFATMATKPSKEKRDKS